MSVLGVDLSTKTVTAVHLSYEQELLGWWHLDFSKHGKLSLERANNLGTIHLLQTIPWHQAKIVCFERPAGKGLHGLMDMMRVEGMCLYSIWEDCWPIHERPEVKELGVTEWKKLAGLPGNASKDAITLFAMDHQNIRASVVPNAPQDFYDAYCIALAALAFNKKGQTNG